MQFRTALTEILVVMLIVASRGISLAGIPYGDKHIYLKSYVASNPAGFEDFDDGFPLGNGDMGAMLGGGPDQHIFYLCKSDIWDSRIDAGYRYAADYEKIRDLVDRKDWDGIHRLWQQEKIYHLGSFLTAGRVTIALPGTEISHYEESLVIEDAKVHVLRSTANLRLTAETFICADANVMVARYSADRPFSLALTLERDSIIPPPRFSVLENYAIIDVHTPGGPRYAAGVYSPECADAAADTDRATLRLHSGRENSITVYCGTASENDTGDPVSGVRGLLNAASGQGVPRLEERHRVWWQEYFGRSSLTVPRKDFERGWYFELYKMGSCSRPGEQAPGLFGLWIGNDKPGWSGDYHLDLNVQMQLWPLYTSNHLEQTESFMEMYRDILPEAKRFAQVYYKYPSGAKYPLCTLPKGGELHISEGWLGYQYWAGVNAWVAEAFIWRYRSKPEPEFAREWLPLLEELLMFYEHCLEEADGHLVIPLTASPEAGETTPLMWGKNATNDLCLLRQMAEGMIEMYEDAKIYNEHYEYCRRILKELVPYPVKNGVWCELDGWNFPESHRHASILMPVYPTAETELFDTESDEYRTALASYREFVRRGEKLWCSFTYPWMSAIAARLGLKDETVPYLDIFERAFRNVNGLTINFDWKILGHGMQGGKFHILEGGNGFAAALNEMMLESHGGVIQVFRGCPDEWAAGFRDFLAFGGFLVSASKTAGTPAEEIKIESLYGKRCRVRIPWKRGQVAIHNPGDRKVLYCDEGIIDVPVTKNGTAILKERR